MAELPDFLLMYQKRTVLLSVADVLKFKYPVLFSLTPLFEEYSPISQLVML